MRQILCLIGVSLAILANVACNEAITVLEAQSLPWSGHALWTPSANATSYVVTLDGAAQPAILASVCSPTECQVPIAVSNFGAHTVSVVAQNLALDSDLTSTQSSDPASLAFILNPAPAKPTGPRITK